MQQQITSLWQKSRHAMTTEARWPDYFQQKGGQHVAAICQTLQQLNQYQQHQQGWILVLAPSISLSKQFLEQCRIDCRRVLLINAKQVHHYDNLMRDALTCSTCSAVVSFLPADCDELSDYQYLANKYQTLLVNHDGTPHPQRH